jgi:hypothetical protein
VLSVKKGQLLTQGEISDHQGLARVKAPIEKSKPKPQKVEHGLNSLHSVSLK